MAQRRRQFEFTLGTHTARENWHTLRIHYERTPENDRVIGHILYLASAANGYPQDITQDEREAWWKLYTLLLEHVKEQQT